MASTATAKVRGKMREAASLLSGYPGIFRHLAGEHAEVAALMKKVAGSSETSATREELFPEIHVSLLAHATAEEREFYGPLRDYSATDALVSKALDQHQKIKGYLEQLIGANKATKTWLATFERLMRAVEVHVDMEENELFPAAKDVLTAEVARRMEQRYCEAEKQMRERI